MQSLINIQADLNNRISKSWKNYKKSPKDRITQQYVQTRLELLEQLWVQFNENHIKLVQDDNPDYEKEDLYDSTEETYLEYKCELKTVLTKFCLPSSDLCVTNASKSTCSFKLPKLTIPPFCGKYSDWVTFRDLFNSLIHNNQDLEDVQKLHYLKGYVTGEAEQLLRHIPIADSNYQRCWSLLESRYNNKKYISHCILKKLLSQKNILIESSSALKELIDTTSDCLSSLGNIGIDVSSWDIIIIHILTLKLDTETRKQWEFNVTSNTDCDKLPTFEKFKDFLTGRYRALEFIPIKSASNRGHSNVNYQPKVLHVSNNINNCIYCDEHHKLMFCKKFCNEDVDTRREFVRTHNLCYNCLGTNHGARMCQNKTKCKICKKSHHSLLHPKSASFSATNVATVDKNESEDASLDDGEDSSQELAYDSVVSCFSTRKISNQVLLATALVQIVSNCEANYTVRALLDQGSQASFITESTVQRLGLNKIPIKGCISGLGGGNEIIAKSMVKIKIKSLVEPSTELEINAYVLKTVTSVLPVKKIKTFEWINVRDICLADPHYNMPNKIDLLLGAEVYGQIIKEGIIKGPLGTIVAQCTSLGWILSGIVETEPTYIENNIVVMHTHLNEDDTLKKFWEIEDSIPSLSKLTPEQQQCEDFFAATTVRDETGRYVVRLPFKGENHACTSGDSRDIAKRRLLGLETRLNKNKELKNSYKEVIDEYLQLGHMEAVPENERSNKYSVYLPHHAVVREDKVTTKVRVVFDASCKGKNGISLNNELMVGPTLQADLRHIIMRWRYSPICLAADIIKMYRQVLVDKRDTDYQRVLWRNNPDEEIKDYRLLTVTFGTASAPYLAVKALQQLAADEGKHYPAAAEKVLTDFYMDDLMTGCSSVEEGVQLYNQMNELLYKGGFILQKWTSNSNNLIEKIRETNQNKEIGNEITLKTDEILKILGLFWNRSTDAFHYLVNLPPQQNPATKRNIISDISHLFDPLGWVAPTIVLAKILIQRLWLTGLGWDEEVATNILNEWTAYREELHLLSSFQIPRWLGTKTDDKHNELHGFCDASKMAYSAVVYLRAVDKDGNVHVSLVTAKTKVAPIKQISIPRLELCGAGLVCKLLIEVADVMGVDRANIHAWTDSTIVLAWMNSHPYRWKTFVANRVSEILTSMESRQWSHVTSKQNPADCASRGMLPSKLVKCQLWLRGPEFLAQKTIQYSKPKDLVTNLETVKTHCTTTTTNLNSIWDNFSSLTRLIRVLAYCRRFLNMRKPLLKRQGNCFLTSQELSESFDVCIRECQNCNFKEELKMLDQTTSIKKGPLRALNPFLDEKRILRVGGRLEHSNLPIDKKNPILIPKQSHLTNLIIADAHQRTLHGGPQLMLNYLNSKYFIIGAKQLVRSHVRKCVICVKHTSSTRNQLMGQLPSVRLTPSRAFKSSGVDYAGPIHIRTTKGRGHHSYKGYICLFICMATRAIHLEVVSDYTAVGFLQAFKRFVARRGHCFELWSDNGTNFVGASKEMKKLFSTERSGILAEVAESLATNSTEWRFIPPHAPNFGGLWEAGIKSTKYHLKRIIGNATLTYEEMSTVLAQIEACLNSRPISRVNDETVLTPGHFLVTEPLVTAPDYNYETCNVSNLRRWQLTQKMMQDFWRKWSQEYLSQFYHRYKWSFQTPEPKLGDIVLVKEDNLPPCRWLYGKIVEKHPGSDGLTRVVTLQTKHSFIKRPISKLCFLPVSD